MKSEQIPIFLMVVVPGIFMFIAGACLGGMMDVSDERHRAVKAKVGEYRTDPAIGRLCFVFGCSVPGCPNHVPTNSGTDVPKGK